MELNTTARRTLSFVGMMMVGDAAAYMMAPKGHFKVWTGPNSPGWYTKLAEAGLKKGRPAAEAILGLGAIHLAERV